LQGTSKHHERGEAHAFKFTSALTKPINPARIFASFCLFFFQKEKEGVRIKKTEALETSVESSMSQAFSLLYINRRAVFYLKTPCFRLNAIIVYHKKIICQ
jgi:hypothetical protein